MKKFVFAAIAAMVMVSVSNVFASSKMMGNSQVAPVDTVAPADSTVEGTAISSQASVEDSAKHEIPVENTSAAPVEQVENAQPTEEVKAQDAPVENTQQESTEQTVENKAVEQQAVAE